MSGLVALDRVSKMWHNELAPKCFVAGTLVSTEDGDKPIEKIEAGDMVWAANPETGEVALKRVVQTFVNEAYELVHVTVDGEEIITTYEHPFYVAKNEAGRSTNLGKGWVKAGELHVGDVLLLQDGRYATVKKLEVEQLTEPVTVYNFEVEDFHTYFVGVDRVLVHNICYDGSAAAKMNDPSDIYHSFPTMIDTYITPPAYSNTYTVVSIGGSINGIDGYYTYGFIDGKCTHRCFEIYK